MEKLNYIGSISVNENINGRYEETLKEIYMLVDQIKKDGGTMEIEKYYVLDEKTGGLEFLAGNIVDDGRKILLDNNSKYSKDLNVKDSIESKLEKLAVLERERIKELEEIAKVLGISKEDIDDISELNLEQKIDRSKEHQKDDNEKDEEDISKENKNENKKDDKELDEKKTEKLTKITGNQEVNIDARYDGRDTLRTTLGLSAEDRTIMVVSSNKLNEIRRGASSNSSPFAFVAIRKDGTAHEIESLQLDTSQGAMPNRDTMRARTDGTMIESNNTLSRYKIRNNNEYIGISRGTLGEYDINIGYKTYGENDIVEIPLETKTRRPIQKDVRELLKPGKGTYNIDNMHDEAEYHFENGDRVLSDRSLYDGKEGGSHTHDEKTGEILKHDENEHEQKEQQDSNATITINLEEKVNEWADLLMENENIETVFTKNEVKDMIEKQWIKDMGSDNAEYSQNDVDEEIKKIENNIESEHFISRNGR